MAKDNTPKGKQVSTKPSVTGTQKSTSQLAGGITPPSAAPHKGHQHRGSSKGARSTVGGSAVAGAKSTQPRQVPESNNQQQQQHESYNRDMRRRMERMGYEDDQDKAQSAQTHRKKRMERLKERRQQQLAQVRKSLPGGKIDTSTRRVYYMIAVVAVILIIIIAIFAILRATGH